LQVSDSHDLAAALHLSLHRLVSVFRPTVHNQSIYRVTVEYFGGDQRLDKSVGVSLTEHLIGYVLVGDRPDPPVWRVCCCDVPQRLHYTEGAANRERGRHPKAGDQKTR
jgi:hypothetical protein